MAIYKILSEDFYGKEFFKKLVERLKEENIISKTTQINTDRFHGKCYEKSGRVIKTGVMDFDNVIVVADADNPKNKSKANEEIEKHILKEIKNKVKIIILDYEIEEWICYNFDIKFQYEKPSVALNDWCRKNRGSFYKKYQLPNFVKELNIKNLLKYPSFNEFVNACK